MPISKHYPRNPFVDVDPDVRWFPSDDKKLLAPLVPEIRKQVFEWRQKKYEGASETSKQLLTHWFYNPNLKNERTGEPFRYYFAQKEALESIIYLYEVKKARTPVQLMAFSHSQALIEHQFKEDWTRYVIKMATGSGKTKVLSLVMAWAYFNRLYEDNALLSKNFLLVAPNIIVLDRLKSDFEQARIFYNDPILPPDNYGGKSWSADFEMKTHIQDEVNISKNGGNLFLTNIHRIYSGEDPAPSKDDENTEKYFLGSKPKDAKKDNADVGKLIRQVNDLIVLNDEAHHAESGGKWFGAIQDISNKLKLKGTNLSLQVDVSATPVNQKGYPFPQTISDYPLVEAVHQKVVKKPLLPDEASQAKIQEQKSYKFTERYRQFLEVGYVEFKKQKQEWKKFNNKKKPILFIMVDYTYNCDEVGEYLENTYKELEGKVLVIHTNKSGEISEVSTNKNKEELDKLREQANDLDNPDNPYEVVVSVLVLKEGWDIKNVTTIVGLRAYTSKILPEQTIGRGLRRMTQGNSADEYLSLVGTENFIQFIQTLENQGVDFDYKPMGENEDNEKYIPLIVGVDLENTKKDKEKLDIAIPITNPALYREDHNLRNIDPANLLPEQKRLSIQEFSQQEQNVIVFKEAISNEEGEHEQHHALEISGEYDIDPTNIIRWFVRSTTNRMRLVSKDDVLYGITKQFIANHLFTEPVDLQDRNVARNLSRPDVMNTIHRELEKAINEHTVQEHDQLIVRGWKNLSSTTPFHTLRTEFVMDADKTIFNKVVNDSVLEMEVAQKLDRFEDIISFAKNDLSLGYRIWNYQDAEGNIHWYVPDFFVKIDNKNIVIVETKGGEYAVDSLKIKALDKWCEKINKAQPKYTYSRLYIDQETFDEYKKDINSFETLHNLFKDANPVGVE